MKFTSIEPPPLTLRVEVGDSCEHLRSRKLLSRLPPQSLRLS